MEMITQPIFAIDNDEDDIDLLRIMLRKAGIPNPMKVYREGEKALAALAKFAHDSVSSLRPLLCFLDVRLPSMNGHEILRWIRDRPPLNAMPVVMLSSSQNPVDVRTAAQIGAQCYLCKYPISANIPNPRC
jgi:CheY-like chemotaxis protein